MMTVRNEKMNRSLAITLAAIALLIVLFLCSPQKACAAETPEGYIRITSYDQLEVLIDPDSQLEGSFFFDNVTSEEAAQIVSAENVYVISGYHDDLEFYYGSNLEWNCFSPEDFASIISDENNKVFYKDAFPLLTKLIKSETGIVRPCLSFSDAVSLAANGDCIKLFNDVNENNIVIDKELTIDLNGHFIDGTGASTAIINVNRILNICDSSSSQNGTIKNGPYGGIVVNSYSDPYIQNYKSKLVIENVVIENCSASCGGAIYVSPNTDLNLINCQITGNSASQFGGGIFSAGSTTIIDSNISNNTASICGGGVYVPSGTVNIDGKVVISENTYSGGESDSNLAIRNTAEFILNNAFSHESDIGFTIIDENNDETTGQLISNIPTSVMNLDYVSCFIYDGSEFVQSWKRSKTELWVEEKPDECILTLVSKTGDQTGTALLSGGGTYTVGTSVTATAHPYDGVRFTGWFKNGELLSADLSYTFTITEDTELTGQFEIENSFVLTISGDNCDNVSVSASEDGLVQRENLNVYYSTPGKSVCVTLDYNTDEGENFLYWADANGNKLSGRQSFSFVIMKDTVVDPMVSTLDNDSGVLNVRFFGQSNNLISIDTFIVSGKSVEKYAVVPTAPSLMGKQFEGWKIGEQTYKDRANLVDAIYSYACMEREPGYNTLDIFAVYAEETNQAAYNISVKYEGTSEEIPDKKLGPFPVGQSSVVTISTDIDPNPFLYWTDSEGNILSYTPSCTVRPHDNIVLIAVFGDESKEDSPKPAVNITDMYLINDNGAKKIRTTISYVVPENEGYTVIATGMYYSTDPDATFGKGGTANTYISPLTSYDGNITVNYNFSSGDEGTFTAAGYVTVEKDGEYTTFVSETKSLPFAS